MRAFEDAVMDIIAAVRKRQLRVGRHNTGLDVRNGKWTYAFPTETITPIGVYLIGKRNRRGGLTRDAATHLDTSRLSVAGFCDRLAGYDSPFDSRVDYMAGWNVAKQVWSVLADEGLAAG